ncbi:adhesion G protein-coupled receptor E3-like [Polymixia lowei]
MSLEGPVSMSTLTDFEACSLRNRDECEENRRICGPVSECTNVNGSYTCACQPGFTPTDSDRDPSRDNNCVELELTGVLVNWGSYQQTQSQRPSPSVKMVSGIGNQSEPAQTSSEGDGETGSVVLHISERLVSALVEPTQNHANRTIQTSAVDLSLQAIGPENSDENSPLISTKGSTMEINLQALARNNNGSAAAAFMTVSGMENLLSHRYFQTKNKTEMYSDVITAVLPKTNNTKLSQPVNFTIQHKQKTESGLATCVYWEDKGQEKGAGRTRRWSVEGCWVTYSDENYTVCSCSHLSTFALIMQTGEPPPENPFLEWLNRVCVIIGLFFFALAILTFLLCSWNPKINNTARLHLCINLSLSHLLLLWNDRYVQYKLVCAVIAGLLHFLVVASFVWMLLEALQLHLLVQKLSKVKIIQRDGLPRPVLYLVGYGVALVIVGVSASVNSGGYGGAELCWLSRDDYFNWALTGPVILILAMNLMLFCATLWCLRTTLANMKSNVSQSNDTRLILFKILAQFVILGCTWLLGLYQTNVFFQFLFIVLNSQQGTFLYIVHCLLNKEVREEYKKWLTCSSKSPSQEDSLKDASSDSEDFDKEEEEQTK